MLPCFICFFTYLSVCFTIRISATITDLTYVHLNQKHIFLYGDTHKPQWDVAWGHEQLSYLYKDFQIADLTENDTRIYFEKPFNYNPYAVLTRLPNYLPHIHIPQNIEVRKAILLALYLLYGETTYNIPSKDTVSLQCVIHEITSLLLTAKIDSQQHLHATHELQQAKQTLNQLIEYIYANDIEERQPLTQYIDTIPLPTRYTIAQYIRRASTPLFDIIACTRILTCNENYVFCFAGEKHTHHIYELLHRCSTYYIPYSSQTHHYDVNGQEYPLSGKELTFSDKMCQEPTLDSFQCITQ